MVNKCFLSELGNLEATSAFGLALLACLFYLVM